MPDVAEQTTVAARTSGTATAGASIQVDHLWKIFGAAEHRIVGTPDECEREIRRYEALGVESIIMRMRWWVDGIEQDGDPAQHPVHDGERIVVAFAGSGTTIARLGDPPSARLLP